MPLHSKLLNIDKTPLKTNRFSLDFGFYYQILQIALKEQKKAVKTPFGINTAYLFAIALNYGNAFYSLVLFIGIEI
jgi:hypothetical protein